MPEWKIHDKWAERIGVSAPVSTYVNSLIDFPEECPDYLDFCAQITEWADYFDTRSSKHPFKARSLRDINSLQAQLKEWCKDNQRMFLKWLYIGHDTSRSSRNQGLQAHIQLKFLAHRGAEYTRAWYLHHILDYAEKEAAIFALEEIFERLGDRTSHSQEFAIVKCFVTDHWKEILKDLGYD